MRILSYLLSLAIFFGLALPATAQSGGSNYGIVTQRFSISAAGTASPFLTLTGGQSVCSIVILNTTSFSGLTMIAQAASDGPYTPAAWNEVTSMDGGGITSSSWTSLPYTVTHSISSYGITNFRINVTGLSSGTVSGVIACSTAGGAKADANLTNPGVPTFNQAPKNFGNNAGQAVSSYGYAWNGTQYDGYALDPADALETTAGGTHVWRLTSTSTSGSCVNIASGKGRLVKIWNTGPATTIYPQFYDDSTGSCAGSTLLWGDGASIVLPAGQTILSFDALLSNGLSYKLSGSLSTNQNIVITTYGLGF